jgi:cytidylate kinase
VTATKVFIVIGPAGSGKTTMAQQTAKEHNAAYLDKDRICGRLVEFALEATGHDPTDRESNTFYPGKICCPWSTRHSWMSQE